MNRLHKVLFFPERTETYRGSALEVKNSLHDGAMIPKESIGMEVGCRIKPKAMPLLSISRAINVHICLNKVRLS